MIKKFRLGLVFILLLTSVFALTACSDDESTGANEAITVGITGTPTEIEWYNKKAQEFTEETGIEVTIKQYTDYDTELQAELIGGTAPDVFYVPEASLPIYAEQGVLAPVEDNVDMAPFNENVASAGNHEGVQYTVPKDYATPALYYNKAYVDESEIPDTMEEFPAFLAELQAELPEGVVPMTYSANLSCNMWVAQAGGLSIIDEEGYATLSSPEMVDNLSIIYDAAEAGLIYTPADLGLGWNGEAFGNQQTAMMIEGNWAISTMENDYPDVEYGVIEIPTYKGEKGGYMYTVGWGVNADSENQEAAWEFINYMTSYETVTEMTEETSSLPARTDVADDMGISTDPYFGPHIAAGDYATPYQAGPSLKTIGTEYENYISMAASGEKTLEETLVLIETEANKIIKENLE